MSDQIRIGIVGCGFAGTQTMYAPILRLLEKGRVTALMDPDTRALDFMVQNYGAFDCYSDYDLFLERAAIDAVLIATPVFLHEPQVIAAARAGKHILCEKPMAPTIEACDRMIAAARAANVKLMIGFVRRFDKGIELASQMVAAGELGDLVHIRSETSWCHDNSPLGLNWRQSRRTLGGVFQDNASHSIDLAREWAGEIKSVSGHIRRIRPDWEVETHAHATLQHTNGVITTIHVSNVSHKPTTEYYLIEGTRAALEVEFSPLAKYSSTDPFLMYRWEQSTRRTELTIPNYGNLDRELRERGMYKRQLDDFCESILDDRLPRVDGSAGRKATEVIDAVYLSAWSDSTIQLPLASSENLERVFAALNEQG